jgi:hypothetical protein
MRRPDRATRRGFLKGFAVAAGGAAAATLPSTAQGLFFPTRFFPLHDEVLVFRLRTRNTRACHACEEHHKYIVCRTRALMNANRAHEGCNCPIVIQSISRKLFRRLFPRGSNGVALLPRGGDA